MVARPETMQTARIIIVDTNDGAFINAAIASALRQTLPSEVVVVDNASCDGSPEWIEKIPGVRVIRRGANDGFGAAVNTGAVGASTSYLAFLNPDAEASPQWLETMTTWMDRNDIDVACSYVGAGDGYYFTRGRWVWWLGGSTDERAPDASGDVQQTDFVNGCAMVIRTALFHELGGFDEGFFLYSDDVDLSLRAVAKGRRIGVCPQVLVRHDRHGSSTKALGDRKWTHAFSSRGRVLAKHCPSWIRPFALLAQAFVVPIRFAGGIRAAAPLVRSVFTGYASARRERSQHP